MPAGSATGRDARSRSDAATLLDSSWLVDAGPPLTLPAHPGHLRSSRTAVRAPSPSTSEAHESVHTHAFLSIVKDLERHWRTIHDDGSITRFFDLTTCRTATTGDPPPGTTSAGADDDDQPRVTRASYVASHSRVVDERLRLVKS